MSLRLLEDGIASVRLCDDERPFLAGDCLDTLADVHAQLQTEDGVRALVIEGGARWFSGGASRAALLAADPGARRLASDYSDLPRLLLALPVPTVAAMAGHAVGGGFVVGLWTDAAVLAGESLYGANFMALGFTPGMGSTAVLPEVLGGPLARELMYSGRLYKGHELKARAPQLDVVPRAQVLERALQLARVLADAPREALSLLKATLSRPRREALDRALVDERRMHAVLFADPATRERIASRYAEEPG